MPLTAGARLGPYEIVSLLGAGGMGEVYRARDARLGRDVAIKVLPAAFSADPERLSRFEQEARAAAALNHPNIVAVFDVGTGAPDSAPYVVSELLEGETLRERLAGGALPVRKAIEYGIQIAHGLAAAHEKGIVHRDLKPENIFLTSDGRAKILDFGLAKLTQPEGAVGGMSNVPTTPAHTQDGMVLGTLGYMAPEQVRGRAADHRADIFAFGAVLYEMLSGKRAFHGDTTADTMTAILKEDPPDLPVAERHMPPALARIIDRCLEKTPSARFGSAADLAFALDALSVHSDVTTATATASGVLPARRRAPQLAAWMGFALCALALAAVAPFAIAHWRERPAPVESVQFSIGPPFGGAFLGGVPSVSPDGRMVAYVASGAEGANLIWIRSLNSLQARSLPGTDDASGVFWSPDSRFVGFFTNGKLKKAELAGGAPQTVCTVTGSPRGGAWGRDDVILYGQLGSGLSRVSANGGEPVNATPLNATRKDVSHLSPNFLPDGRRFLYVAAPSSTVMLGSLDSQEATSLLNADGKAVYSPPGYLLFLRQGTLMANPFDVEKGALTGTAAPLIDRVLYNSIASTAAYSASDTGVLSYRSGTQPPNEIPIFDRNGKVLGHAGQPGDYRDIDVSHDGTKLIVHKHEDPAGGGLWLIDLARNTTSRFTFDGSHNSAAHWSPGDRVAFTSNRDDGIMSGIYQKIASGAGPDELIFKADAVVNATDWSPDGKFLVFEKQDAKMLADIWVWSLAERKASLFLQTPAAEGEARLSPDGKWMAYVSNETGRNEIYVQPFPRNGGKWQISSTGGSQPRWRRDGRELFFLNSQGATNSIMSTDAQVTGTEFSAGVPKTLFSMRILNAQGTARAIGPNTISQVYAVSPDGQRFFGLVPQADTEPVSITVLTNWTTLLKK